MDGKPTPAELVSRARGFFRRGYCAIDAAGNAGIAVDQLWPALTSADHRAHDDVWLWGWEA